MRYCSDDARDKRKKILRTQVGELRARLNRQLHAEAKALRRAAREELREEVRRLDDEEMARRQSGGINRVHGGGVREFGDQRGTSSSEDHHDRVDPRLAREDINRRPLVNIQADLTNRDPRRRNNPEDDIQFLREYHANTIRRVAAQQREMRQQQRTVEAVRELRQEMGRNGGEDQRRGASTSRLRSHTSPSALRIRTLSGGSGCDTEGVSRFPSAVTPKALG